MVTLRLYLNSMRKEYGLWIMLLPVVRQLILFLDVLFFLTPAVNNNYKSRFLYMTSTDRPLHAATPRMLNFTRYVNFYISLYS